MEKFKEEIVQLQRVLEVALNTALDIQKRMRLAECNECHLGYCFDNSVDLINEAWRAIDTGLED